MRRRVTDIDECDRSWQESPCDGELISRTTAGGYLSATCQQHMYELENALYAIAERYPEIHHPEYCTCYGCVGE